MAHSIHPMNPLLNTSNPRAGDDGVDYVVDGVAGMAMNGYGHRPQGFFLETPRAPLRPPCRKRRKKRPNIYAGPVTDESPWIAVHFFDGILCLPLPLSKPNVLIDNRRFPNRQLDYHHLEEHTEDTPILCKTYRGTMPTEVDPKFNTQFDDALHEDYLREHLKTGHMSAQNSKKTIAMIKITGVFLTPATR